MSDITDIRAYRAQKWDELTAAWDKEMGLAETATNESRFNDSMDHVEKAKNIRAKMLKLGCREPRRSKPVVTPQPLNWGEIKKPHMTYTYHRNMGHDKGDESA